MIINTIIHYKEKKFLIAYSGGMDSTILLHKMIKIKNITPKIQVRAIHINHNLHTSSKKWTTYCINTCKKYNIPLIVGNVHISSKKNVEEQLRIKRYNFIYRHLLFDEILLTGHHLNDQCETLFLSLKRGSGPTGLAGMSFEINFGNKKIVRPLLQKTQKELKKWAIVNKIHWIKDFSNNDIRHDRNFIRHKIIPVLEKKWPFFLKSCFRTATICREETKLINIFLKEKIKNFINTNECLNIQDFKNISKTLSQAFIRYWIRLKNIKNPSYKIIQCIYNEIILSKQDANPKITIHNNEIRRYKNFLYFIKTLPNIKNILIFWHNIQKKLILPNQLGYLIQNQAGMKVPAPKAQQLINIRFQFEGKVFIVDRNKKREIKKIWQEFNIPPWLRNQIPLLFYDNNFISALGVFVVKKKNEKKHKNFWNISWINDIKKNNHQFLFH